MDITVPQSKSQINQAYTKKDIVAGLLQHDICGDGQDSQLTRMFKLAPETKSRAPCWKMFSRIIDCNTGLKTDFVACNQVQRGLYW